jgi:hypothetical protein
MLQRIMCRLGFHKFVYFCRPTIDHPEWDEFQYCTRCGLVGQHLADSQGGSYTGLDDRNVEFVENWIKSNTEVTCK